MICDLVDFVEVFFIFVGMGWIWDNLICFFQIVSCVSGYVWFNIVDLDDVKLFFFEICMVLVFDDLVGLILCLIGGYNCEIKEVIQFVEWFGKCKLFVDFNVGLIIKEMVGQYLINDCKLGYLINVSGVV